MSHHPISKLDSTGFFKAILKSTKMITPHVRQLQFHIPAAVQQQHHQQQQQQQHQPAPKFTFRPGQWIDCILPQTPHLVGGYSMITSPLELPMLGIAVKRSSHPVATAVHDLARPDDEWYIRPGGSFFLDDDDVDDGDGDDGVVRDEDQRQQRQRGRHFIFLAGGIGITPLLSMMRHLCLEKRCVKETNDDYYGARPMAVVPKMTLLYSVKCRNDLAFWDDLLAMTNDLSSGRRRRQQQCHEEIKSQVRLLCFLTGSSSLDEDEKETQKDGKTDVVVGASDDDDDDDDAAGNKNVSIMRGRITYDVLKSVVGRHTDAGALSTCYVCGPKEFSIYVDNGLREAGVGGDNIKYETWW